MNAPARTNTDAGASVRTLYGRPAEGEVAGLREGLHEDVEQANSEKACSPSRASCPSLRRSLGEIFRPALSSSS
ncbi:hypothetical protein ACFYQA_07995 [Streptomyces sp. NPDC005774]|uniref:hypothetical protein n=1 Tax=Streptomyces sp. NPDC005774 TaxID=3364728 RepID=UPI003673CDE2